MCVCINSDKDSELHFSFLNLLVMQRGITKKKKYKKIQKKPSPVPKVFFLFSSYLIEGEENFYNQVIDSHYSRCSLGRCGRESTSFSSAI